MERWLDETPKEEPYSAAGHIPGLQVAANEWTSEPEAAQIEGVQVTKAS